MTFVRLKRTEFALPPSPVAAMATGPDRGSHREDALHALAVQLRNLVPTSFELVNFRLFGNVEVIRTLPSRTGLPSRRDLNGRQFGIVIIPEGLSLPAESIRELVATNKEREWIKKITANSGSLFHIE